MTAPRPIANLHGPRGATHLTATNPKLYTRRPLDNPAIGGVVWAALRLGVYGTTDANNIESRNDTQCSNPALPTPIERPGKHPVGKVAGPRGTGQGADVLMCADGVSHLATICLCTDAAVCGRSSIENFPTGAERGRKRQNPPKIAQILFATLQPDRHRFAIGAEKNGARTYGHLFTQVV